MKTNVLLTGGTGLIGKRLTELLLSKGYSVSWLSRRAQKIPYVNTYLWDIEKQQMEEEAIQKADYIVHLAGAGVADKAWTESYKKQILESRTQSTALLAKTIQTSKHDLKAFISASAIGIYGNDTGEKLVDENSPIGNDFLAEVTQKWEQSVQQIESAGIRTVKLRIGVVLSKEGGTLAKLVAPIRLGAGATLGSGKQHLSWIHIEDLCEMFLFVIEQEHLSGVFNAVGKQPLTNAQLTKAIAQTLKMPLILPNVPSFVLKLMLGEMASIVLGGSKISSEKIENSGFRFKFVTIEAALQDLLKH